MTPEQRIAELERKIELLERVMKVQTTTVEFSVPVNFKNQIVLNGVQISSGNDVPTHDAPVGSVYLKRATTGYTYTRINSTTWDPLT